MKYHSSRFAGKISHDLKIKCSLVLRTMSMILRSVLLECEEGSGDAVGASAVDLQSLLTQTSGYHCLMLSLSFAVSVLSSRHMKFLRAKEKYHLLLNGCPNQTHPVHPGSTHLAISGDGSEETPGNYS